MFCAEKSFRSRAKNLKDSSSRATYSHPYYVILLSEKLFSDWPTKKRKTESLKEKMRGDAPRVINLDHNNSFFITGFSPPVQAKTCVKSEVREPESSKLLT